jgi:hypothetical protein
VLLSFALFADAKEKEFPAEFMACADKLEERLLGSKDLPILHVAAASAAILAVKNGRASKKIRIHVSKPLGISEFADDLAVLGIPWCGWPRG